MRFQSTLEDRKSLRLTIYTGGFGVVKEVRRITTAGEVDEVQFLDVAEQIETDSILVRGLEVLEQNYDDDLVSGRKLLKKFIGEVVTVRNPELGEEIQIRLLHVADDMIGERIDTKEIMINPSGELILPSLPDGLSAKPALIWKVVPAQMDGDVQVSYLTQGVEWQANYAAEIAGNQLNLTGWVKLQNRAGTHFINAKIKLIAGDGRRREILRKNLEPVIMESMSNEQPFDERSFADYHAYTIERPVTVLNEQTKQISFLKMEGASFRKIYKVGPFSQRAEMVLEIDNTAANQLGIPLPKGLIKVYEQDVDGEMEFVGEDVLEHTSKEEKLKLTIGNAFDIVSDSREKKRIKQGGFEYVTHEYRLKNRKGENVRVDIEHVVSERIWEMESSTHDYEIKHSSELEFRVRLAADKSALVEFTYKVDKRKSEQAEKKK
ncbi:DUF4139 domain-containing protein [Planococcus salinus]|uniref:DUF4139 domain-containing protein n=1 Tax=Planococcus salinus TaxID=1848460 RepID=A0A3M8P3C2_9BACL|nr:DUF4139 domain-containing protein [Planococcus salinus]RNF38218.1 DUF4139 domain-containing protein [Planococcus salinus]